MKRPRKELVFVLCFAFAVEAASAKYAIVLPKTMRCGQQTTISASVFDASGDVDIIVNIKRNDAVIASARDVVISDQTKVIGVTIPVEFCHGDNVLVQVRGEGGLEFVNETGDVQLAKKMMSIYVQTDKAMYKPGQKVLFRAFAVYPDLKPYMGKMDVNIFDPNGNKIKQWVGQELSPGHPFASHELRLSAEPVIGDWKIHIDAGVDNQEKIFTVAKYVLPKFEVAVELPPYHLLGSGDLTGRIQAKYTYGKPVAGKVAIAVKLESYDVYPCYRERMQENPCPSMVITKDLVNGSVDLALSSRELATLVHKPSWAYDGWSPESVLNYSTIVVRANVTEELSGITLAGDNKVPIKRSKYVLEFLELTQNNYKPKMTYVGFIQIKDASGQPPNVDDFRRDDGSEIQLRIKYDQYYKIPTTTSDPNAYEYVPDKVISTNEEFSIPPNGLVMFNYNIGKNVPSGAQLQSLNIYAQVTPKFADLELSSYKSVQKFLSKSEECFQVSLLHSNATLNRGERLDFLLKTTTPVKSFTYQILSKGDIVISKTVTASVTDRYTFGFLLDDVITQKMAPSAKIIVWCILPVGELITDSLQFNVAGAFSNDVSIEFNVKEARPADEVQLTVSAHPGSLAGILAVDQSVLLLKGGNDIGRDQVMSDLMQYGKTETVRRRYGRSIGWRRWGMPWSIGGKDTQQLLDNAGVIVLTDALIHSEPIIRRQYMMSYGSARSGMAGPPEFDIMPMKHAAKAAPAEASDSKLQEVDRVRTKFPETWLWSDITIGKNGSAEIRATVPDTITSWVASGFALSPSKGLGIAPNAAKLTVFKPFFLSLNLPYSVIRGEEFALIISIFNYLQEDLRVRVTLEKSKHYELRDENNLESSLGDRLEQWLTIAAGQGSSTTVWVQPLTLGSIYVEVKAQSKVAADAVKRMLPVEAEGVRQEYSLSTYINLSGKKNEFAQQLPITYPSNVVEGSQQVKVMAVGDIMGPSISGVDNLLRMPYGCGEQNMLNFAPNIFVMQYLRAIGKVSQSIEEKAKNFMEQGYQQELTYQRDDGSFSAFGKSDPAGSVWLTAFVLKSFQQAKPFIFIDNKIILKAANWVMDHQNENGSFAEPPQGRVIHTDMQGGSSKGYSLTAYVLNSLLEARGSAEDDSTLKTRLEDVTEKAINYLVSNLAAMKRDAYALAITTYALSLAGSNDKRDKAIQELNKLAKKANGMKYWTMDGKKDATAFSERDLWAPPHRQAKAENIELNSYALLAYTAKNDVTGGIPIMKWLVSQRNSLGGFASTQDTVMGLQSLAAFTASLSSSDRMNMKMTVTTSNSSHQFETINRANSALTQIVEYDSPIEYVNVSARGSGVGLLQVSVIYNVLEVDNSPEVVLAVESRKEGDKSYVVDVCTTSTNRREKGMALVSVDALTGTHWDDSSDDTILEQLGSNGKRVENDGKTLTIYMDQFTRQKSCFKAKLRRDVAINNQQPAKAEAYVYYRPNKRNTQLYLPQDA